MAAPPTDVLEGLPLFQGLSKRELREILRAADEVEFLPGDTITEEGTEAIDFYVIVKGQATVAVGGVERRTLGQGDSFGEIAALDGGPRSATVRAKTQVVALRFERHAFLGVLDRHGTIARKILVEAVQRFRTQLPDDHS